MIEALLMTVALSGKAEFDYKNPWPPTKKVEEIPDSLYRGFHYEKKWESFRKCILARESGSNFKVESSGGSGAFQFVGRTWDHYVAKIDPGYVGVRPNKAPPYLQEEVFWIAVNPYPKKKGLAGRHHWSTDHTFAVLGKRGKEC